MEFEAIIDIIERPLSGEWGIEPRTDYAIKVLRNINFTNSGVIDYTDVVEREIPNDKILKKKLRFGDILIEKSGGSPNQPVGRVVFFDQKEGNFLYNNFTSCIRPKEGVLQKYLFYQLFANHAYKKTLRYQNKTTGILNLQLEKYLTVTVIPLPSLPDQRRIAAILDHADAIRRKNREILKKYDQLAQSVFLEMFGKNNSDYLTRNEVKIKDLAADSKNSMRTGPFGSDLLHSEFADSGIAVLGIDNVVENSFSWKQRRYITKEKYEKLKRYTVYPDDVLVTIMGTIGRSAVVPTDIGQAINTKHLVAITVNHKICNPHFLSFAIHSDPFIVHQLAFKGRGAIMAGLNLTILKELKIKYPSIENQNQFAEILKQIDTLKNLAKIELDKSENLFQSLLQRAFKGEI